MSMVGDLWRDRNWMAIGPIGKYAAPVDYLTRPTQAYPCGATVDYNAADGFRKYSVLSNLEIEGGSLVGVDVHWSGAGQWPGQQHAEPLRPVDLRIHRARAGRPAQRDFAADGDVEPHPLDEGQWQRGEAVGGGEGGGRDGGAIAIEVVSPDGSSTSTYTVKIAMA